KSSSSLILVLYQDYGEDEASTFVGNIQSITSAWCLVHGFSIGLDDCLLSSKKSMGATDAIKSALTEAYIKAQGIQETTSNPGIREVRVTAALSQASSVGMRIAKDGMDKSNRFLSTVNSGAKGDYFNIAQIMGLLGQQNLDIGRVPFCLN